MMCSNFQGLNFHQCLALQKMVLILIVESLEIQKKTALIPIQVVYPNNVPHEDGNPFMFVRRQCTFGEGAEENAEQQGQAWQHDDVQQHEDAEHVGQEGKQSHMKMQSK